jgi:predicted transposase YbfD/YdcC
MEEFGKEREEWLKEKLGLELEHGIPDGDTFKRVISRIKPMQLRQKLNESLDYIKELRDVVPIDGKTKKSSGCKSKNQAPLHIISAFSTEHQLVLGEIASENKKSEQHEIPKLLDVIDVKDCIVTIDAGGCQKKITEKIIAAEADYVLTLKKNHRIFHEKVESHFASLDLSQLSSVVTEEKKGNQVTTREYWLETDIKFLDDIPEREKWAGLLGVGMSYSEVEKNGEITTDVRYFITSLTNKEEFADAVRKHWNVESMHWCLDVIFREDSARGNKENSAMNINILQKHANHLLGKVDLYKFKKMGKKSKKRIMLKAAYNTDVLEAVILCAE